MYMEICSVWYPWAARGQPAQRWASPGLQGTAALHLEHLLSSFCTNLWGCLAASLLFLTPLSQLLSCSFSLSSICSPRGTTRISHTQQQVLFGADVAGSGLPQGTAGLCSERPPQQFPALLVLSLRSRPAHQHTTTHCRAEFCLHQCKARLRHEGSVRL